MNKITYRKGDATSPYRKDVIVHVCNNIGAWGSGFVVALSKKWPEPEAAYRKWHQTNDNGAGASFSLGRVQYVQVEPNLHVANMICQEGVGVKDGVPPIRYDSLRRALHKVAEDCAVVGASVHMPRIGCGLAGGDWPTVEGIIYQTLGVHNIPVTVYDL